MKISTKVGIASMFAAIGIMNISSAAVVDATINSNHAKSQYGSDPRPGLHVSGFVNPDCVATKDWDLRFVGFDPNKNQLIIGGGFNQLTGKDGYSMGDIFFDTDGILTSPSRPSNIDGYLNYPNPEFEFCIDITSRSVTDQTLTYSLIGMYANSIVQSGALAQNGVADPSTIVRSSVDTDFGTGVARVELMSDNEIRTLLGIDIGNNGGPNYVSFFDLPSNFLPPNTLTRVHTALTCGNEDVGGQFTTPSLSVSAVPETGNCLATMVFLSWGMLIRLRRRK